jgi:(R,R)-butanediol dehydrogenase/meso-butanediol dehydrogenase/diacetyl reductase
MKAVRLHNKFDLRVGEVALPGSPPPGHVNIEVQAAGICGRIVAVAADVEYLTIGDRVVADTRVRCGSCPACTRGQHNVCERLGFVGEDCDGGFAEQIQLPARLVIRLDPALEPEIAVFAGPLAVVLHAVARLDVPAGEPVLVAGCGTISFLVALVLSCRHDGRILVSDTNADRARLEADLSGGTPVDLDPRAVVAPLGEQRLLCTQDATEGYSAIGKAITTMNGRVILVLAGIGDESLLLDPTILVEREISLVGSHALDGELINAVSMLPEFAQMFRAITETVSALEDVPEAYQCLLDGRASTLKMMIQMPRLHSIAATTNVRSL